MASPKGEGRPDPTVFPRIASRHFGPLLPLNAYGGEGVRAKYLLKPDAAGLKVAALASLFDLRSSTLTPALSRRERVSYTAAVASCL
jgi:hypothetical protein